MIEGFLARHAPRLPQRDSVLAWLSPLAVSATIHAMTIVALVAVVLAEKTLPAAPTAAPRESARLPAARIVFLPSRGPGGGGGGGGNRQPPPIRRAERVGTDRLTIPVARPLASVGRLVDVPAPAQQIVLDAKPLASGLIEQIGAIKGGVGFGTSQGPGSGDGVGDGVGTGIGSGRGPGVGPGTGGGSGGGVYRPGGAVTPPTILSQVRPSYTNDALRNKIQGTVVLEVIVRRDGIPSDFRIVRSLDRRGLDEQAIAAVQQWRFNPGRLAGTPVDVLVTVVLDFSIH